MSACLTRFDVALWREWFSENNIPDVIASVYAPTAFSAIAGLMRACRCERMTRAAAYSDDRTLIYRAHKVQLGDESACYDALVHIEWMY